MLDMSYGRCPFCSRSFLNPVGASMVDHLINCAKERVTKTHPEVMDEGEGPESAEEMLDSEDRLFLAEDGEHYSNR